MVHNKGLRPVSWNLAISFWYVFLRFFLFLGRNFYSQQSLSDVSKKKSCSCCLLEVFSWRQPSWEYFLSFGKLYFLFLLNRMLPLCPKSSNLHPFLFFLKKRSSFCLYSCLQEKRRTFLETIGFFEQRLLFEKETCLKGFCFSKSCFWNILLSKEWQHVNVQLILFLFWMERFFGRFHHL